jgi:hypothetical protein
MKKVIVRNLGKQMRSFVLTHQDVCVKAGRCFCNKNGTPMSVHVPALRKVPVVAEACYAPDIKKALKAKRITLEPCIEKQAVEPKVKQRVQDTSGKADEETHDAGGKQKRKKD